MKRILWKACLPRLNERKYNVGLQDRKSGDGSMLQSHERFACLLSGKGGLI